MRHLDIFLIKVIVHLRYLPVLSAGVLFLSSPVAFGQQKLELENENLRLVWEHGNEGYVLKEITLNPTSDPLELTGTQGRYTSLYSPGKPDTSFNADLFDDVQGYLFDEYKFVASRWRNSFRPVPLNTAGTAYSFFPSKGEKTELGMAFFHDTEQFVVQAEWTLDRLHRHDILVEMRVSAKKAGYFSMATPTLFETEESDLGWAILPGYFQGNDLQSDLLNAYAYGQGIPNIPVVVRERTASTLAPLLQNKSGVTLAVVPEPGTATDPWRFDRHSRNEWRLGLSLMNRDGQLSPTLYHPVLGEVDSYMEAGEERVFRFRYSLQRADWFSVYKRVIYDIYEFDSAIKLKNTNQSLTARILAMLNYLKDDSVSLWKEFEYDGLNIGAQSYLGGVVGADRDAMKNADYGAMWMLATITGDSVLRNTRLEAARNFKLTQQQTSDGFFKGAAMGQYYLWKKQVFTEEWGDHVEPIALTYYTMLDIGNILLFEPDDDELKERLRNGADRLLAWQQRDGSWHVAYDRHTTQPVFNDQRDLRPTFYGLLVAYKLLGDEKYLHGAVKGADWFVKEAVEKGHFLGVCGDVRFVPDFATGQSSQALLDLYEATNNKEYLDAAIAAAKLYTTSVYTHPIPSQQRKQVGGKYKEDWEISQVGLSFEHGGIVGSANSGGPILLASHAGLFVRMAELTGEQLFLDMARAAAWGRDAFVDSATNVASYYWNRMDNGPGPFPHHAWWQVGWITDYLMAEITLRSHGNIRFPKGFITPKVGPHQSYGFAPGNVFGKKADLYLPEDLIKLSNRRLDFILAKSKDEHEIYLFLLNNSVREQESLVSLSGLTVANDVVLLDENGGMLDNFALVDGECSITMSPLSLRVIKFSFQQ